VDTHKVEWDVWTHIKGGLQLEDVIVQVAFEALWKKMGNIIKKVGKICLIICQTFTPSAKHDNI
jgi:hypothetical protein